MENIILKIKEEADKKGLTSYKIGKITGFAPSQVTNWLSGKTEPSIGNAQRLAEAVGLRIDLKPINAIK